MTGVGFVETDDAANDVGPPRPWVLVVDFEIHPGGEGEFLAALNPVNDAMRHEVGFMATSLLTHPTLPNRFRQVEVWQSRRRFLEVELRRAYRAPYEEMVGPLLASPRRYSEWYELRADFVHHLRR